MKKRLLSLALTLAVMLTLCPAAFAAKTEQLYVLHYNWGEKRDRVTNERIRMLLDQYWSYEDSFTIYTDVGRNLRLMKGDGQDLLEKGEGKDLEVDEIWCEVDGERSDRLYMEEMDWGDFSTWWFQAGEEMEGELCVLSDGTEYRMPFRVKPADVAFYDENGHVWSPPEITEDPSDCAAFCGRESYGIPGREKTVELRLSESAWAKLETVELNISDENSNTLQAVVIAQRVNGTLQLTGKSLSGVKLSLDAPRRAIAMTLTMPSRRTVYGFALYGYRANREFELVPGEAPTAAVEPEVPAVPADPGLKNFKTVNTYLSGQFKDVASTYWGAPNIAKAYELGLMKGSSVDAFDPEGSVTVAQTVTMAARLHSIYATGTENFVQSGVWYQTYVDYCKANGILKKDFADYNAPAQRGDFAAILAAALPEEALPAINTVNSIPDVAAGDENADAIYALYCAGILTGNDASGTFGPETSINRAAAAAILTRMADTSLRKNITL